MRVDTLADAGSHPPSRGSAGRRRWLTGARGSRSAQISNSREDARARCVLGARLRRVSQETSCDSRPHGDQALAVPLASNHQQVAAAGNAHVGGREREQFANAHSRVTEQADDELVALAGGSSPPARRHRSGRFWAMPLRPFLMDEFPDHPGDSARGRAAARRLEPWPLNPRELQRVFRRTRCHGATDARHDYAVQQP